MPQGGTLTIATRNATPDEAFIAEHPYFKPGDYAVLLRVDTGTGISEEVQQHMFEPFFTTKSVGKGTGLGLSTVYGIVKQSGGYLIADSVPGHGACFSIYLPRVQGAVLGAEMRKTEWLQRGAGTLLVVEDEAELRGSIHEFLDSLGYTILDADCGPQALTIASQFKQPIDLMITDLVMPKMSGRELSQLLGDSRPGMKTIFMSGYTDDAVMHHGVHEAGVVFLQKPFSLAGAGAQGSRNARLGAASHGARRIANVGGCSGSPALTGCGRPCFHPAPTAIRRPSRPARLPAQPGSPASLPAAARQSADDPGKARSEG